MTATPSLADETAIVGIGYSRLSRNSGRSVGALALEAGRAAIRDAGLTAADIDGVTSVSSIDQPSPGPGYIVEGLGIPRVTMCLATNAPSINPFIVGVQAVAGGTSQYCLVVHAKYRWSTTSKDAAAQPLRVPHPHTNDFHFIRQYLKPYGAVTGFPAIMRRHMFEFGSTREDFAMIAVNNRTNARENERAVLRSPITVEDYLNARMVWDPFCLLDMDMPVDGAMAVVITNRANAERSSAHRPVYVGGVSMGTANHNSALYNGPIECFYDAFGAVGESLWRQSGVGPRDIDLANLYDGFSILTMLWMEALLCGKGNGPQFLREGWDEAGQRLRLWGRMPLCTHGGNLSEGRVQGFGHVLEAVQQLRGEAGARQVDGARIALVTNGTNGTGGGAILRTR